MRPQCRPVPIEPPGRPPPPVQARISSHEPGARRRRGCGSGWPGEVSVPRPVNGPREVTLVAFQRAMSSGPISRRLGMFAVVLLPVTFFLQLPAVLIADPGLMRTPHASCMVNVRAPRLRPGPVLATILPAVSVVLLMTLIGMAGCPPWLALGVVLGPAVIESAGGTAIGTLRLVCRQLRGSGRPRQITDLEAEFAPLWRVDSVTAYPRHCGHGKALMQGLNALLDGEDVAAVLTARTSGLIAYYEMFGYRSLECHPRQDAATSAAPRCRKYVSRDVTNADLAGRLIENASCISA